MKIILASFALALTFSLAAPIVAQNNSIFEVSPSQNKTSYDLGRLLQKSSMLSRRLQQKYLDESTSPLLPLTWSALYR